MSLFIFLLSAGALERGLAAEGDKVGGGRDQAPGTGQTSRERKSASTSGESQAQTQRCFIKGKQLQSTFVLKCRTVSSLDMLRYRNL